MYNFTFQIPRVVPASVEHTHGYIRYEIIAILGGTFVDLKYSIKIKVVKSVGQTVAIEPALQRPCEVEIVKHLAHNSSIQTKMIVSLQKRVFVAGEDAVISIDIYRIPTGVVKIKYIEIKLLKIIRYTDDGCCGPESTTNKKTVKKEFCPDLPVNGFKFKLPSFIASTQNLCKVFDVSHFLEVKGKVGKI